MQIKKISTVATALMGLVSTAAFFPSRSGAPPPSGLQHAIPHKHMDQPPSMVFLNDPFYQASRSSLEQEQVSSATTRIVEGESEAWADVWVASKNTVPRKKNFLAPEHFDMQVQREALAALILEQQDQKDDAFQPVSLGVFGSRQEEYAALLKDDSPVDTTKEVSMCRIVAPVALELQLPASPAAEAASEFSKKIAGDQQGKTFSTTAGQPHPVATNVEQNRVLDGPDPTVYEDAKRKVSPIQTHSSSTHASRPHPGVINSVFIEESASSNQEFLAGESTIEEAGTKIHKDNTPRKAMTLAEGGLAAMALIGLSTAVGMEVSTLVDMAVLGVAVSAFSSVLATPKKSDREKAENDQLSPLMIYPPTGKNQTAVMTD